MTHPTPHLGTDEYKGQPQVVFCTPPDPADVISYGEQQVSFGAAKANILLLSVASNGPDVVLQHLLDCAAEYEPSERKSRANPPLTDAQRRRVEDAINALSSAKSDDRLIPVIVERGGEEFTTELEAVIRPIKQVPDSHHFNRREDRD